MTPQHARHPKQHQERRRTVAFLVFCCSLYLLSAPGRIVFPDDEIVFQTTRSLYDRGSFAIAGIPRRTGEPKGRPSGTFGWSEGPDGQRYGFFGHGLSVVAMPMYGLGKVASRHAPPTWRHAIRSDHFFVHRRGQVEDWTRLVVSLTNCILAPLAVWLAMVWTRILGFSGGARWLVGVGLGLGSLLWPTTRTFLSEPLSMIALLGAAVSVARAHRDDNQRWLWVGALLVGGSCHIHLLNLVAIPAFVGYAFGPRWHRRSTLWRPWAITIALGATGVALLGLGQALRFGSPFESGRFGHYSHFIVPTHELAALVVSPGRSLWWSSPILLGALFGWRTFRRRMPATAWFCLAVVVTRLVFVASRSDWWGGWAIGPRFLIPVIPFALLPIAAAWDHGSRRLRVGLLAALAISVALQAHLAQHSIFEWMLHLHGTVPDDPGYLWASHWWLRAAPAWGFMDLPTDVLRAGAGRLSAAGHEGLARITTALVVVAVSSLALTLWPSRSRLRGEADAGHAPAR